MSGTQQAYVLAYHQTREHDEAESGQAGLAGTMSKMFGGCSAKRSAPGPKKGK